MSFYAVFCQYGTDTLSDGDQVLKFENKKDRDDWVEEDEEMREPIHRDVARRRYGEYYDAVDWGNEFAYPVKFYQPRKF